MNWWKWLCVALLTYTFVMGLMAGVPTLPILNESIRNLYFHVPMWFGMIILLLVSVIYSIKYLKNGKWQDDVIAVETANLAVVGGILGITTGMVWAKYTWGDWWSGDPKQNASAIGLLIYLAYFILRSSLEDPQQRAKVSAVYNIFAFAAFIPLIYILPRLTDSLHPGAGGNPGFNTYDLDSRMRMVFYPSVIAWTLLLWWIASVRIRWQQIQRYVSQINKV
jgi:heme exporter protein C